MTSRLPHAGTRNSEGCARPTHASRGRAAFTLVELLVVVAVIVVMMTLAVPAFNAMRGTTDFASEVYDISGLFEQARANAMANNTFVLVGIGEYQASQSASANTQATGAGRIAIAIIASADGTRPYQSLLTTNSLTLSNWQTLYGSGGRFSTVNKLATFQNIHMVDLQSGSPSFPTSGNMARTSVPASYDLSSSGTVSYSATPFGWPLGTALTGSPQYTFNKVIEFDPEGSARIISSTNLDAIPYCIEVALQPSFGTTANQPASGSSGQIAAIQIDGMSGATRVYRP